MTLLGLLGAAIVLVTFWDIMMSALGAGTAGPLAPRMARAMFAAMRPFAHHRFAHRICGPLSISSVGAMWIALLLLGWSLVFASAPGAVVETADKTATGPLGRIAFVGHLLGTLGGGLNEPGGQGWGLVSALAGVCGMIVLTLSVSFVYSTTQAVASSRAVMALAEVHPPGSEHFSQVFLPQLGTMVAQFKSIPFALHFSTERERRRVPRGLWRLRHDARLTSDQRESLDILLHELPGLESAPEEGFDEALRTWARQYDLGPRDF